MRQTTLMLPNHKHFSYFHSIKTKKRPPLGEVNASKQNEKPTLSLFLY